MLRAFDVVTREVSPPSIIAIDGEVAVLRGGGESYAAPWHWHDCLMLLIPCIGALYFQDEDSRDKICIYEDRFVAVPAHRAHHTVAARETHRHIVIYVTDRAMRRLEENVGSFQNVRHRMKKTGVFRITQAIRSIQEVCRYIGQEEPVMRAAEHHLGLALLLKCLGEIDQGEPVPAASPTHYRRALIAEIKVFVEDNVDRDLPLNLIAKQFDISRRHITRLFREVTGGSIGHFQQLTRIKAAKKLLTNTDLPVGEIAFRVGLESGSALANIMRSTIGQSPTDVRKSVARSSKI